MAFDTIRRLSILVLLGGAVAACAPPPPKPPEPTVAQVTISAASDANPSASGGAFPAVVFIYALKPGAPFSTGSYDALTGGELGTLAETMSRIGRLVIVPGKSMKKVFELPPGITDIGVAVGFQLIDTARWRASAPVTAHQVTLVKAAISGNTVNLE